MQRINEDIKNGNFKQIYLLYGEERYLKNQYTTRLRKALCQEGDEMNTHFYQGKDFSVGEVIDLAETLPFLAERRVMFFKDTGLFKAGGEKLAEYLASPNDTTFFVFTESEVDKRSKLYKTVQSKGYVAEFTVQDENSLKRWIAGILGREGKKISENTAQLLLSKTGTDMENIQMELEKLICKIYEDNALGKLPDARYEALDAQYAKEQDALNAEITELEKAVTGYEQSRKSAEKFIALIDKYENFDTLTNIMLNEFVEKILVHERARKGSQDTTQEVEIYFNFVGRYIPPALQPVPLTPEEQEELRKKEERKDRLHQNYLRRKANGKQKEWEERYNAKRKAQREAAKAAIRAEDMEKGIFIPVSQLPRQEPRKATVSASTAV